MIPSVDDLRSSPLVHRFGDLFNPPGLTNFLGCAQSEVDPVAVRSINFPPLAMSDTVTGQLFLDGRYFPSTGAAVTTTWQPDRIVRTAEWSGWEITSTTGLALGAPAVVVRISVTDRTRSRERVRLRLATRSAVTHAHRRWDDAAPPCELDNAATVDATRKAVVFTARHSTAACVQGTFPPADSVTPAGLEIDAELGPDGSYEFSYVVALGTSGDDALALFDRLAPAVPDELERVRGDWNAELRAVFTPGNDRYSGHLPMLETDDEALRQIWYAGVLGVVYFKRDSPASVLGRTYDTLLPRYWQGLTFLWDYSLSSLVHALLDPAPMRRYLKHWMSTDVHTHMGTEWLTGEPVGMWYAVNDFAMTRTLREYVRWTGDMEFLDEKVPAADGSPRSVLDYLEDYANSWQQFRTSHGLADYGGIGNLLECVSTYVHEVASLNAANVFNHRVTAELLELLGRGADAERHRSAAAGLVGSVQQLYADGAGHWFTRFPGGELVPVKHCYDFSTVVYAMGEELSSRQRDEMVRFFVSELQTPTWMRALSASDPDAAFSVRPDHQWNGAYPAWPPEAAAALFRMGRGDVAMPWLRAMAASANQGPFGQAHFAEDVIEPDAGGARKAPSDSPYINDWTCSGNGSWVALVIEHVFGVRAGLDGTLTATPALAGTDPGSRLVGLSYQGDIYDVDATGLHRR